MGENVSKKREKVVPRHFLAREIERIRIERGISKRDICGFSSSTISRYNKFLRGEGGMGMAKIVELFDRLRFDGHEYVIVDKEEYEALLSVVERVKALDNGKVPQKQRNSLKRA